MPRRSLAWLVMVLAAPFASAQETTGFRPLSSSADDLPGRLRLRSSYRSTVRSNARGTAPFETPSPDKAAARLAPSLTRSADRTLLPPRYMAEFSGGKRRPIADYRDDGDSFWIQWIEGGHARYLKRMVARFDSLSEEESAQILAELQAPPSLSASAKPAASSPVTTVRPAAGRSPTTSPRRYELGPLRAEDFASEPPSDRGRILAYTYSAISYHYRYHTRVSAAGVQLVATQLTAAASVLPDKSWNLALDDVRLLDHEQGHFDITQLHAIHWRRHAGNLIAQSSLVAQAGTLEAARQSLEAQVHGEFQAVYDAWQAEQLRYDNETVHGVNRHRQSQWRERLNSDLAGKGR